MSISRWLVGGLALGLALGCSNVGQMQRKYEQGDAKQYNKIIEILARQDYPYATRKRAAAALGDIGDPRAVPILVGVLSNFDQRTTLKQEVLTALGKIGGHPRAGTIGQFSGGAGAHSGTAVVRYSDAATGFACRQGHVQRRGAAAVQQPLCTPRLDWPHEEPARLERFVGFSRRAEWPGQYVWSRSNFNHQGCL